MSSLSTPLPYPPPLPHFTKCSSHGGSRTRHEETVEMKLEGPLTNACQTAPFSSFVVLQFLEHQIYIKRNELFFGFLHSLFDSPPITSHFKVLIFSVEYWFVTRLLSLKSTKFITIGDSSLREAFPSPSPPPQLETVTPCGEGTATCELR